MTAVGLALAGYGWLVHAWFGDALRNSEAPAERSASALLPPALTLALGIVLLIKRRGWPRLFQEAADRRPAAALFGAAVLTRVLFLPGAYGLFSSDAAVQGVMALHILEARHHPVYLYRWSYIGSLKAHLTAVLDLLVREPVLSFLLAAVLFYGLFVVAVFVLARSVLPRSESIAAGVYVVLSPGFLTAWGINNEGSYIDVLALGTVSLAVGARYLKQPEGRLGRAFGMGLLTGLAFWSHLLATYYLLAALLALVGIRRLRQSLTSVALFLAGWVVGDFPGLWWNAFNDWTTFRWWTLDQADAGERWIRTATQLKAGVLTALPVLSGWWPTDHPPWPAALWRPVLTLLIPASIALWVIRFRGAWLTRREGLRAEGWLPAFAVLVILVFAQSEFGWLAEEPRYLLFLFSVAPVFVAAMLGSLARRTRVGGVLMALGLLAVNLQGTGRYLVRAWESDGQNRRFLRGLEALGVRYGHTDYFVSYKYHFLSHGRLVLTSALGPSQTEWYFPFREEVSSSGEAALIPRSFRLARRICRRLDSEGISYRRADLLYPVIYELSRPVDPALLR